MELPVVVEGVMSAGARLGLANPTLKYYRACCCVVVRFCQTRESARLTDAILAEFLAAMDERLRRKEIGAVMRSNLEIPQPIARFLSLCLLTALGLKGGFALAASGLSREVVTSLLCALLLAAVVPALGYVLLRRWLHGFDAAAIAAPYGSVSAVTFITAV